MTRVPPPGPSLGPGVEFDLIRRLAGAPEGPGAGVGLGPGDDCAVLEGGVVVSVDISLEGVHFRRDWITLEEAAFRAAAGALSDLAAMAAEPLGLLLSMAVAPSEVAEAANAFQAGAREACRLEGIRILGGDLSSSPGPAVLDMVALGRTETPLLRSGAHPGDELWVTGVLGGSGAAVELWSRGMDPGSELRESFARPRPRIREMRWLQERCELRAAIDLSDGLGGDGGHLAAASEVALILEAGVLPIHPGLASAGFDEKARLHFALSGGEDYEVCFAVGTSIPDPLVRAFEEAFHLPLTRIGRVEEGEGVALETVEGLQTLTRGGFSHFKEGGQG